MTLAPPSRRAESASQHAPAFARAALAGHPAPLSSALRAGRKRLTGFSLAAAVALLTAPVSRRLSHPDQPLPQLTFWSPFAQREGETLEQARPSALPPSPQGLFPARPSIQPSSQCPSSPAAFALAPLRASARRRAPVLSRPQRVLAGEHPVVAVKSVRVGDFGGRSLSTVSSTMIEINPDVQEAGRLRTWYDSGGANDVARSLGTGGGGSSRYVTVKQINEEIEAEPPQRPIYVNVLGNVSFLRMGQDGSIMYPSCPLLKEGGGGRKCMKKCRQEGDDWYCESHGQNIGQQPDWKYLLSFTCCDWSGSLWASAIGEAARTHSSLLTPTAPPAPRHCSSCLRWELADRLTPSCCCGQMCAPQVEPLFGGRPANSLWEQQQGDYNTYENIVKARAKREQCREGAMPSSQPLSRRPPTCGHG